MAKHHLSSPGFDSRPGTHLRAAFSAPSLQRTLSTQREDTNPRGANDASQGRHLGVTDVAHTLSRISPTGDPTGPVEAAAASRNQTHTIARGAMGLRGAHGSRANAESVAHSLTPCLACSSASLCFLNASNSSSAMVRPSHVAQPHPPSGTLRGGKSPLPETQARRLLLRRRAWCSGINNRVPSLGCPASTRAPCRGPILR